MPYSVQLGMASGDDWFAPSFVTNADQVAATQVAPLADDPNLIGWYTDSELDWGPNGGDLDTQLAHYLALPAGSPGLAVAQQYVGNPNGFVYALATRYFQVTTAAIRMYDPHHLILGVKAEGQEIQPQLLEAASPYVDVFSIDDYQLMPGFAQIIDKIWPQYLPVTATFNNFETYVKRPIMVAEYSFIGTTPQTPDTVPGVYAVYPDQADPGRRLHRLHRPAVRTLALGGRRRVVRVRRRAPGRTVRRREQQLRSGGRREPALPGPGDSDGDHALHRTGSSQPDRSGLRLVGGHSHRGGLHGVSAQGELSAEHLQHRPTGCCAGDQVLQLRHHHRRQAALLVFVGCRGFTATRPQVQREDRSGLGKSEGLRKLQLHGDGSRFVAAHTSDGHPDRIDHHRSEGGGRSDGHPPSGHRQ